MDKVLVDTSAWIEFFRKREPWHSAISGLMDDKRVCCSGLILAELIQGAKSEKELEVLREFRHVFEFLDDTVDLWQAAGELSHALQRKGKTVGLSDCFLAVSAKAHDVQLLTLDKHFEIISSLQKTDDADWILKESAGVWKKGTSRSTGKIHQARKSARK